MKQRSVIIVSSVLVALAALICFFVWNHFHAMADYSEKLSENEVAQNQTQAASQLSQDHETSELDNNSEAPIDVTEQTESEDLDAPEYSMEDDSSEYDYGSGDYILAGSDIRYIHSDEVRYLSDEELRLARNEIFARNGRMFDDPELSAYFSSKSWYHGTIPPDDFSDDSLSEVEKANIDTIQAEEARR